MDGLCSLESKGFRCALCGHYRCRKCDGAEFRKVAGLEGRSLVCTACAWQLDKQEKGQKALGEF